MNEAQSQKPSCYTINRILILGMPVKSQSVIRNLILSLQKQSSVDVFMNLFQLAAKTIYAKIASSQIMIDSFNSAYENILPTITKFPKAFIPAFVGVAANNDDFCDNLIQNKVLYVIATSPKASESRMGQSDFDTLMQLICGLILIRSPRQGDRFQMVLQYLLQ